MFKFKNKNQKGNVLFLILIAVALFAALSYAVTQSSRSGSDASKETSVINTASLTQYPNSVRTAVLRLIIAGYDPLTLVFNRPDEFEYAEFPSFEDKEVRAIFHPEGGGAVYQQVPSNILETGGSPIDWKFSADYQIPLLGLSGTNGSGNELIAFAEGVTQGICGRVNKELHNDEKIPVLTSAITIDDDERTAKALNTPVAPTTTTVLTDGNDPNWFSNKAFGCFKNGSGVNDPYIFYYVLAER